MWQVAATQKMVVVGVFVQARRMVKGRAVWCFDMVQCGTRVSGMFFFFFGMYVL